MTKIKIGKMSCIFAPTKERDGRRHRRERGGCILSPDLSRARSSSKLRIRWATCPDISLKGVGIAI